MSEDEIKADRAGEFDLIAKYLAPLAGPAALGLRDDAAILPSDSGHDLIVTTDSISAGVHYPVDEDPARIAHRLLRVNLSDLAAKGAEPVGYLLNLVLGEGIDEDWIAAFTAALAEDQRRYAIPLLGSDTVSANGPPTLTITAIGRVPVRAAIRRDRARVEDDIWVSGTIGDAALGLMIVERRLTGFDPETAGFLEERYRVPDPRVSLGPRLLGRAHAAADVSDGLLADLGHIAEASDVAAELYLADIPLSEAARRVLGDRPDLMRNCLTGGDDYEIVMTAPPSVRESLGSLRDPPLALIGTIVRGSGVRLLDADGVEVKIDRPGYTHA